MSTVVAWKIESSKFDQMLTASAKPSTYLGFKFVGNENKSSKTERKRARKMRKWPNLREWQNQYKYEQRKEMNIFDKIVMFCVCDLPN